MFSEGFAQDYGFRIYHRRIARFLSVDPLTASYPWYTPYQFAGNKPIQAIDLDGLEEDVVIDIRQEGKKPKLYFIKTTDVQRQNYQNLIQTTKVKSLPSYANRLHVDDMMKDINQGKDMDNSILHIIAQYNKDGNHSNTIFQYYKDGDIYDSRVEEIVNAGKITSALDNIDGIYVDVGVSFYLGPLGGEASLGLYMPTDGPDKFKLTLYADLGGDGNGIDLGSIGVTGGLSKFDGDVSKFTIKDHVSGTRTVGSAGLVSASVTDPDEDGQVLKSIGIELGSKSIYNIFSYSINRGITYTEESLTTPQLFNFEKPTAPLNEQGLPASKIDKNDR